MLKREAKPYLLREYNRAKAIWPTLTWRQFDRVTRTAPVNRIRCVLDHAALQWHGKLK